MDALASLPNMNVAATNTAAAQPALPSAGALPPAIPGMPTDSTAATPTSDAGVGANTLGTSAPLGGGGSVTLTSEQISILTSLITALTAALSMLTNATGSTMPMGGPSDPKATTNDKAVQLGGPSLDPTQNGLGGATTDPLQLGGPKDPAKDPAKDIAQSMPLGGPTAPTTGTSAPSTSGSTDAAHTH